MTAANLNYKVGRRLIVKWHKRFRDGRESLQADSGSGRPVNAKLHNLAESLMDACINKGSVQYQEIEMNVKYFQKALTNVILKSDILLRILSFSKSRKYEFIRTICIAQTLRLLLLVLRGTQDSHVERCVNL